MPDPTIAYQSYLDARARGDELERQIMQAMDAYLASKNGPPEERMRLWILFLDLHAKRSPQKVADMEAEQGLR